jgi:hypothetical protein
MAIHMVTQVGGEDFKITLSRDDAGNYVAEAARLVQGGLLAGTIAPHVRVVDSVKERALSVLFDSLRRQTSEPTQGPDAPAAA